MPVSLNARRFIHALLGPESAAFIRFQSVLQTKCVSNDDIKQENGEFVRWIGREAADNAGISGVGVRFQLHVAQQLHWQRMVHSSAVGR